MSATDGGQARFEDFYEQHQDDLARLAYLVMGEEGDAADVAADALVSAWQHWERVCATANPLAYVRRMVVNIAISRVRTKVRDRRRFLALIPGVVEFSSGPDAAARHDVRAALLRLPPRRRACLVLRYAFDLSEEEVAATMKIAVGTVKSQTAKAAAQLRDDLQWAPGRALPVSFPGPLGRPGALPRPGPRTEVTP